VKLYMHPASITSRIVRLYAAEKGVALDEEVVDLFTGAHHQEPFVSVNPNRMVPVLEDGAFRLCPCRRSARRCAAAR
jgi:glutathione S-transferase